MRCYLETNITTTRDDNTLCNVVCAKKPTTPQLARAILVSSCHYRCHMSGFVDSTQYHSDCQCENVADIRSRHLNDLRLVVFARALLCFRQYKDDSRPAATVCEPVASGVPRLLEHIDCLRQYARNSRPMVMVCELDTTRNSTLHAHHHDICSNIWRSETAFRNGLRVSGLRTGSGL